MANQLRSHAAAMMFLGTSFKSRMSAVLDLFRFVILPRLTRDSPDAIRANDLVQEFENCNQSVGALVPALLFVRADFDAAGRLRRDVASNDEDVHLSALRGLIYWLDYQPLQDTSISNMIPLPPSDLLHELGNIVEVRRQPGLLYALDAVRNILRHFSSFADDQFRRSVTTGLEYLLSETEYRAFATENERVPFDLTPAYREQAAGIARLLADGQAQPPEPIQKWIETARRDPLPQVRRAVLSEDEE